jgi:hypothetical protein
MCGGWGCTAITPAVLLVCPPHFGTLWRRGTPTPALGAAQGPEVEGGGLWVEPRDSN